jgi:hypothetical protein
MSERISLSYQSKDYHINPIGKQFLSDGIVRTENGSSEGITFTVSPENRETVLTAIENIQKFIGNPKLAITPALLNGWTGTIEAFLVPPCEVVGPDVLVKSQNF